MLAPVGAVAGALLFGAVGAIPGALVALVLVLPVGLALAAACLLTVNRRVTAGVEAFFDALGFAGGERVGTTLCFEGNHRGREVAIRVRWPTWSTYKQVEVEVEVRAPVHRAWVLAPPAGLVTPDDVRSPPDPSLQGDPPGEALLAADPCRSVLLDVLYAEPHVFTAVRTTDRGLAFVRREVPLVGPPIGALTHAQLLGWCDALTALVDHAPAGAL